VVTPNPDDSTHNSTNAQQQAGSQDAYSQETYRQKQVFEEETAKQDEDPELSAAQLFEQQQVFTPVAMPEEAVESPLEASLQPKKVSRWAKLGIASFAGLCSWQLLDAWYSAVTTQDWLGLGWAAFGTALVAAGAGALGKEWLKLRRLKKQISMNDKVAQLIESDDRKQAEQFIVGLHKQKASEQPQFQQWTEAKNDTHSAEHLFTLYDNLVLSSKDIQAKALISQYSSQCGLLVAASPFAIADIGIVAWRSMKMINELSRLYGVELGYWSRIALLRQVFITMAAAGATEVAVDAGADILSMDMTARVSTRLAQGVGVGLLVARLGIRTVDLLRPVEWQDSKRITLMDMRTNLLKSLKTLTFK
jgi:putative membrane protein